MKKQNGTWVRVIGNTHRNQQSTVLIMFLGAFPSFVTIFSARFQRIYGHESLRSSKWNRGRHCNLFAQKWNFEQMELWAEFLNTKTQNGIPVVRERTVTRYLAPTNMKLLQLHHASSLQSFQFVSHLVE